MRNDSCTESSSTFNTITLEDLEEDVDMDDDDDDDVFNDAADSHDQEPSPLPPNLSETLRHTVVSVSHQ